MAGNLARFWCEIVGRASFGYPNSKPVVRGASVIPQLQKQDSDEGGPLSQIGRENAEFDAKRDGGNGIRRLNRAQDFVKPHFNCGTCGVRGCNQLSGRTVRTSDSCTLLYHDLRVGSIAGSYGPTLKFYAHRTVKVKAIFIRTKGHKETEDANEWCLKRKIQWLDPVGMVGHGLRCQGLAKR